MKIFILLLVAAVATAQGPPKPKPPPVRATEPPPLGPDPCDKKKCSGVGQECVRSKSNPEVGKCVCIESCNDRELPDPLCTNNKMTFNSICEYESAQCKCKKGGKCPKQPGEFVVYYSACQADTFCNVKAEMVDYPRRLAQWLRATHAARSMLPTDGVYSRDEIMTPLPSKDRAVASQMYNSKKGNFIYVSWWFCSFDQSKDGSLDKKELSVLTRALMPNEQCIENFLNKCDGDSNGKITDGEWHTCFDVPSGNKTSCADLYKPTVLY